MHVQFRQHNVFEKMFTFVCILMLDIDECEDPSVAARCVENAECCNLPAHFLCKCLPGFEGDGEEECRGKRKCYSFILRDKN